MVKPFNVFIPAFFLAACTTTTVQSESTQFQPIEIDFEVVWDQDVHPFTGATAIDIDGDGRDGGSLPGRAAV